jgi:2-polyprenyl-3-methyl-5-hydroxy-6-metoxy-1,4-benzoquinol methylase
VGFPRETRRPTQKSMPVNSETKQYETCPICSSSIKTWRIKKAGNEKYKLDLCGSCGYSFVNPRPSLSYLIDFYSSFGHGHDANGREVPSLKSVLTEEQSEPNSTIDARRLVKTIKSLTKNGSSNRFLDIGCGCGFFSKAALGVGFEVIALELPGNEIGIAKEMTGLNPASCSFEEFECASESLQVVLMSQILEHALDVNLWINKAHDFLVHDGIIAIALPNYGSIFRLIMQENDPYICPPAHLNFFNLNSLSRLLENHGFRVEVAQWVSRIPKTKFEKRLPKFGKPLLPIINVVSSASLKIIDALHLGMMINVYGRKIRS